MEEVPQQTHRHGLQDLFDDVSSVSFAVVTSLHDPGNQKGSLTWQKQEATKTQEACFMLTLNNVMAQEDDVTSSQMEHLHAGKLLYLSNSSPPVTSSRTRAMSVSVSKISFSWIWQWKPQSDTIVEHNSHRSQHDTGEAVGDANALCVKFPSATRVCSQQSTWNTTVAQLPITHTIDYWLSDMKGQKHTHDIWVWQTQQDADFSANNLLINLWQRKQEECVGQLCGILTCYMLLAYILSPMGLNNLVRKNT